MASAVHRAHLPPAIHAPILTCAVCAFSGNGRCGIPSVRCGQTLSSWSYARTARRRCGSRRRRRRSAALRRLSPACPPPLLPCPPSVALISIARSQSSRCMGCRIGKCCRTWRARWRVAPTYQARCSSWAVGAMGGGERVPAPFPLERVGHAMAEHQPTQLNRRSIYSSYLCDTHHQRGGWDWAACR